MYPEKNGEDIEIEILQGRIFEMLAEHFELFFSFYDIENLFLYN
ncbi:MAG: hypothetical protein ACTSO9_21495 [Candidatus Helarchaeota archaeon]